MGLLEWQKRFRASQRFDPERAAGRMPAVTIRPLRDEDIPACHAMYKVNEEGRLPEDDGNKNVFYCTLMSRSTWEACLVLLQSSGVDHDPDPLVVPASPIAL